MAGSKPCPPGCSCGRHKRKGKRMPKETREKISRTQIERLLPLVSDQRPALKRCSQCDALKEVPRDFPMERRVLKSGIVRYYPKGECKECAAERTRVWKEREKRAGRMPERYRHYERNRDIQKRREAQAIQRRKQGIPVRGPEKRFREQGRGGRLSIEPFATWLEMQCNRSTLTDVAELTDIDVREIRRWVNRKQKSVSVDAADRVFVALGQPDQMAVLYPPVETEGSH